MRTIEFEAINEVGKVTIVIDKIQAIKEKKGDDFNKPYTLIYLSGNEISVEESYDEVMKKIKGEEYFISY